MNPVAALSVVHVQEFELLDHPPPPMHVVW